MKGNFVALTLGLLAGTALTAVASAQETTGTPGSPSATTTIDGKQLPPPDPAIRRGDQGESLGVDALVATAQSCRRRVPPTCCSS